MPMAALEAMAHARPVVCSRIGGLPELVEDGVTGLLAEAGDAEDLALRIRKIWEDPALAAKLGSAGFEKVTNKHSPDRHYERLMSIYHEAIDGR
jgi:glycosyltransferase involved in cell wall biosynthesis